MEQTITSLRDETQKVKEQIIIILSNYQEALDLLNVTLDDWMTEFLKADTKGQHDLRQNKSYLLQVKSDLIEQITEMKNTLKKVEECLELYHKVIQLRTGDIF